MSSKDSKKLLTEIRELIRHLHYSIHTKIACCDLIAKYIHFHKIQVNY